MCHVIHSVILPHSLAHIFYSFHLSFPALHQCQRLSQLQGSHVPLKFTLPEVVIMVDATPDHWAFTFHVSWSASMCKIYIALQKLPAVVLMLHTMAVCLSGKVVAIYLDKSTTKG